MGTQSLFVSQFDCLHKQYQTTWFWETVDYYVVGFGRFGKENA